MTWIVQKIGGASGSYGADSSMKLVILDGGATADRTALDAKKIEGETKISGTCTDVTESARAHSYILS